MMDSQQTSAASSSLTPLARPLVRRRAQMGDLSEDPVPPDRTLPPHPGPSTATMKVVDDLKRSVADAVQRRLQRPPVYAPLPPDADYLQNGSTSFSLSYKNVVGSLQEAERKMACLEVFVSAASCPPQHELSCLVHNVMLVSEDETLLRRGLRLLRLVAGYHAPHSSAMRAVWCGALAVDSVSIAHVLEKARSRCLDVEPSSPCHAPLTEFFEFLVTLLEEDMAAWSSRPHAARSLQQSPAARPLLARVLWPHGEPGFSRHHTPTLCQWLVATHAGPADMTMRLPLLRLVAMAAGLVQISSGHENFLKVTEGMKELAMELARAVENADLPPAAVEELLCSLRPAWLCAWTAAGLLELRYGRSSPTHLRLQLLSDAYLTPQRRHAQRPSPAGTENSGPTGPQVSCAANGEPPRDDAGLVAGRKRRAQSPLAGPAGKRPFIGVDRADAEGTGAAGAAGASPAAPAAAERDYSLLLYHLLTGYLLCSGVTEARSLLARRMGRPAAAASVRSMPRYLDAVTIVQYNRELHFLEERLWRAPAASWLHRRFACYMRNVTKL